MKRKLLDELRANREEIYKIAAKYGVSNIRVFGSVARGEETKGSDIDLLVDLNLSKMKSGFDILRFEREVSDKLHRKVDAVTEKSLYHMLREPILKEARPL